MIALYLHLHCLSPPPIFPQKSPTGSSNTYQYNIFKPLKCSGSTINFLEASFPLPHIILLQPATHPGNFFPHNPGLESLLPGSRVILSLGSAPTLQKHILWGRGKHSRGRWWVYQLVQPSQMAIWLCQSNEEHTKPLTQGSCSRALTQGEWPRGPLRGYTQEIFTVQTWSICVQEVF